MTNRRTLFAIACLGLLTFGIVFTTLGAVLPEVITRFGIGKTAAGSLLTAIGAAGALPLVATALTPFPAPKQAQGFPLVAAKRLLRDPVLLTFGLMLFLESGMEVTVGGWTTTYFKEELQTPERQALV